MGNKRILWLDYARMFAISAVLLVHSAEIAYSLKPEELLGLGAASSAVRVLSVVIGRLGVPVFLMITGYLLLDRDYSSGEKIKLFYKRNLLPLVITVEAWIVIYAVYQATVGKKDFVVIDFIKDLLFLKDNFYSHLWYMPMIIGIYLAIPFVSNAIKDIDLKTAAIPLAVLCLAVFGIKSFAVYDDAFGWELSVSKKLFTEFLGGSYGAYVLLGYFVKKEFFKKIPSVLLWLTTFLSIGITGYTLIFTLERGNEYHLWYDFIGVLICSVCIFELFSRLNEENKLVKVFGRFAMSVSALSFGMYFIHKPILFLIKSRVQALGLYRPVNLVLYFAIIFGISYLMSLIFSKIPKIKKVLLLIKD